MLAVVVGVHLPMAVEGVRSGQTEVAVELANIAARMSLDQH